ncbi:MAG: molybdopterin-binding protein [Methanobacteriaceae archaeon]
MWELDVMGTEFLKIREFEEAKEIIKNLFSENYTEKCETISIDNCYNRVLFNDVSSKLDLPLFNKSLMDGFAIKAEDSFGASEESPKSCICIDQIEAGSSSDKVVKNGECVEIATGAPIPKGADAVAMVEFCEKTGDTVNIFKSLRPNENIAQKGSDIKSGKVVLNKNDILNPGKIGFLSAQGIKNVEVYKKPVVGIISTGNELLSDEECISDSIHINNNENDSNAIDDSKDNSEIKIGKIYDVNSQTIKNATISCGCEARTLGIFRDNYDELRNGIENGLDSCDIIICSGGTSAGVGDVLRHVIDDIGETIIHGISVKPGKPTIIGKINSKKNNETKLIIGLPGNPISALVVFYAFISNELKKITGINNNNDNDNDNNGNNKNNSKSREYYKNKNTATGKIAKRYISSLGRVEYLLVKLENTKEGIDVYPIVKDSGAITTLNDADAYIKIAKNTEIINEGSEVELHYLN